jgi:molecular chaperone GrpE (heat shock protein)
MSTFTPEQQQQLLARLATWVEELAEAEPAPAGVAATVLDSPEPTPDLFSLLSQMTALTRETQLQNRATNRLHGEVQKALEQVMTQSPNPDTLARRLSEARREGRLEVLAEVLEVRERFMRGLQAAEERLAALRGLRGRFGQRPVLEALVAGNRLARERLDDVLRRLEVYEIPCVGQPFDPTRMHAVDVVARSAAPAGVAPGTVLEVFRAGYTNHGRVLRLAEVKIVADTRSAPGEQDHV